MFAALKRWWNKPGEDVASAMEAAFQTGRIVEREECAMLCEELAEQARAKKQHVRADHYSVCRSHIEARSNAEAHREAACGRSGGAEC